MIDASGALVSLTVSSWVVAANFDRTCGQTGAFWSVEALRIKDETVEKKTKTVCMALLKRTFDKIGPK